jgi:hypothetical protein
MNNIFSLVYAKWHHIIESNNFLKKINHFEWTFKSRDKWTHLNGYFEHFPIGPFNIFQQRKKASIIWFFGHGHKIAPGEKIKIKICVIKNLDNNDMYYYYYKMFRENTNMDLLCGFFMDLNVIVWNINKIVCF